jgi:hypothetical protein
MVALALLTVHAPTPVALVRVAVLPVHTVVVPPMFAGFAFTVKLPVALQPLDKE